jgi:serine/threonine protein kinase
MIMKTSEPNPEQKAELKAKINAVVKRFHTYGYVHNDLKPENIYLKSNGDILLLDIDSCRPIGMRRNVRASSTKGYCMIHNRAPCSDYELLSMYKPQLNFYALSKVDADIDRWSLLKPRGGSRKTRHRKNVTRKPRRLNLRNTR